MPFNLINNPWIPVRRRSGEHCLIEPWMITDKIESDPFVALDAPRPDFNGALIQFLIGLVQTTMAPPDEFEWRKLLNEPPSPETLKDAFSKYQDAFNLDGDGKRFMQDERVSSEETQNVNALLIDAPGDSTTKKNQDHFVKRRSISGFGFPTTAMALFTLQTNAPAGGAGIRTSLRGGGPLTTLVVGDFLWQTIWFNILPDEVLQRITWIPELNNLADIFPWMGTMPTSEKGEEVLPYDVHPLQMYWGTPRRIFLDTSRETDDECSIQPSRQPVIRDYGTRPRGMNYASGVWQHPLTPFYEMKDMPFSPVHGSSGCTSYRHWMGYVQADKKERHFPAPIVSYFLENRADDDSQFRLWAFGYDMDNMKARCWYEGTMPLFSLPAEIKENFESTVEGMIDAATLIAGNTKEATKHALFSRIKDVNKSGFAKWEINTQAKGSTTWIQSIGDAFWQNTESGFYESLQQLRTVVLEEEKRIDLMKSWHRILKKESDRLFDLFVEGNNIEDKDPRCIVLARKELRVNNKNNDILGALQIPKPI